MTDLATLVVKLQAETSQYTEAINKASEKIGEFSEKVGDSIKEIAVKFLEFEALKKAFEFTDKIVEDVTRLSELSAAIGISTQKLSELQYAAKLSGVDDIVQPLERLARAAGQAEQGNTKLIAAFDKLHVSLTDLKTLTPDQVFARIADEIAKYGDGLGKTAIVQQIFGRGSAQLIEQLNKGSEGLKEASAEA